MTIQEMKEFVERQIAYYTRSIEFDNSQIEYYNREIKRERKRDKELIEAVWSVGVVTDIDIKIFKPGFVGVECKKAMKERSYYYRSRKKHIANLERYKKELANY